MNNKGKVISFNGKEAEVSVIRQGSCGENCASCNSCNNKTVCVVAHCDFPVNVGDLVVISSCSLYVYLGLLLVFFLPVALPLVSYVFLSGINQVLSIVFSIIMFFVSLGVIYYFSKNQKFLQKLKPAVIFVINKY